MLDCNFDTTVIKSMYIFNQGEQVKCLIPWDICCVMTSSLANADTFKKTGVQMWPCCPPQPYLANSGFQLWQKRIQIFLDHLSQSNQIS
jgi:hypothetical protein